MSVTLHSCGMPLSTQHSLTAKKNPESPSWCDIWTSKNNHMRKWALSLGWTQLSISSCKFESFVVRIPLLLMCDSHCKLSLSGVPHFKMSQRRCSHNNSGSQRGEGIIRKHVQAQENMIVLRCLLSFSASLVFQDTFKEHCDKESTIVKFLGVV